MTNRKEATVDDLYKVSGKAEIVNGTIIHDAPAGGLHGYAISRILVCLDAYEGPGHALGDNIGFLVDLPNRRSFSPDLAYHVGALTMKFADGAPVFAVEVRNEGDYGPAAERRMADKRADYFAAGTQVVWDVDLIGTDAIRVYRHATPESPTIYRRGERAEAEPALPGWTFPVERLYYQGRTR